MAPSSDQLERQIAEVRGSMESRLLELRDRGRRNLARLRRSALIALGVGAALGVAATGVYVTYRLLRPPTRRERLRRLVPRPLLGWSADLGQARRTLARAASRRLPPIRLTVGEREVAGRRGDPRWARLLFSAAGIAGRAFAGAAVSRLLAALAERREREGQEQVSER